FEMVDVTAIKEGDIAPEKLTSKERLLTGTKLNEPRDDDVLQVSPGTVIGTLGGAAAGVDWENPENTDYKKVLIGGLAGTAGGALLRPSGRLARKIANTWTEKVADPFIDMSKDWVNGRIVNENIRFALGMDRSKEFGDMMRQFKKESETAWNEALELGKELQELAPTALEQKRLMQVIRGGTTKSKKLQDTADKAQKIFTKLRENLKKSNLLQVSRFDKLTRKERTDLRAKLAIKAPDVEYTKDLFGKKISGKARDKDAWAWKEYADKIGAETDSKMNLDDVVEAARAERKFLNDRLNNHYHFGTAKRYAPIYYSKHEGLTPGQKKMVEDEIKHLKIKSRRGNPEGRPELEDMISSLEITLGKGKKARAELRTTRTKIAGGYAHQRMDLPADVQRMLGVIEEAAYPVAKGVGTQTADLAKAKLFEEIAARPDWARSGKGEVPSNFVKVTAEGYGPVTGMHVRKDIWDDLQEVNEWRGAFIKNYDKALGAWKYGKVVLNPATHARNFMSNMILAYWADVNPADLKTYRKAAKAVMQGVDNKSYKEAHDWGLYNNSFVTSEVMQLREELATLRDPRALKNWVRKAVAFPAEVYQGSERYFKTAVFIKAREAGKSVDAAARKAEEALFNYSDIPPWVKHAKRWVSPFITFQYKMLTQFGKTLIRKPWKIGMISAAMYGMEEYARAKLGESDIEAEKKRELLPPWQQTKVLGVGPYAHIRMPFQDKWGNDLYFDASYILPYGQLAEKWGQSPFKRIVMPTNPVFQMAAAFYANKDPFTGREIYDEVLDSGLQVLGKHLEYAYKEIAPPLAPGGHNFNKLKTGFQNSFMGKDVLDWADRPVEFSTAVMSTLLGIKLGPANEKKLREFEVKTARRVRSKVSAEIGWLKKQYQRNEITIDEYRKQKIALKDLERELLEASREKLE
ncbi:hypothetical protein LCGC14_1253780, partial [marine sediment metagenome]